MRPTIEPEFLTRQQAADFLGLAAETLKRWYSESRGPLVCKLGTHRAARVRYPKTELVAFARDPVGYTGTARPEGVAHFEPPSRGNPRRKKAAT
jgi:hypothetical protein